MAGGCVLGSLLLVGGGIIPAPEGKALARGVLGNPYCTGPLAALLLILAESFLRLLPLASAWALRVGGLAAILVLTVASAGFWLPALGGNWIARLYLAATLGIAGTFILVAAFVLTAGLLSARKLVGAFSSWLAVFGPFLTYLACAGFGLALVAKLRPVVEDARLLRMDESLGFHAAVFFGSLNYVGSALWDFQFVFYAGIGAFAMGVTGALYLRGENFALRRCLLGFVLVGLLGWVGYWLFPAVGPSGAWPQLFHGAPEVRQAALAETLSRTTSLTMPPWVPRDCVPSLHTAWSLIALTVAWKAGRRFFLLTLPFGALSILTTLTLCKHYTADVLAAVPFTALCWWLADRLTRHSSDGQTAPPLRLNPQRQATLTKAFFALLAMCLAGWMVWSQTAPLSPIIVWPVITLLLGSTVFIGMWLGAEEKPTRFQ